MSSTNSIKNLQILYFSKKNKEIKNLKNGAKKWSDIGIYTYYSRPLNTNWCIKKMCFICK